MLAPASFRRRLCADSGTAAVKRVLITGMSATGNSTVLAARGCKTVDTDYNTGAPIDQVVGRIPTLILG